MEKEVYRKQNLNVKNAVDKTSIALLFKNYKIKLNPKASATPIKAHIVVFILKYDNAKIIAVTIADTATEFVENIIYGKVKADITAYGI